MAQSAVRTGIVYKITNKISGKAYIGKTVKSSKTRWAKHVDAAYKGSMYVVHKAIRKYGANAFSVRVLKRTTEPLLFACEVFFIDKHDTFKHGYKAKLRCTPEWCAAVAARQLGVPKSAAHLASIKRGQALRRARERVAKLLV